ncbi:MAG: DUF3048 domain-containing protein [Patescibacteria group bacterium]|nr:DUF3048 domain-containing protein [Patescibacteria group bacterium]
MNQKTVLLVGAVLYLAAAAGSYAFFSMSAPMQPAEKPVADASPDRKQEDAAPKTEECPLNGQLYSKAQRAAWEKRRPLGISIENSVDARPQSGLSSADIVYEAVAEGGITRFLGIYYCDSAETVGPVRSARIYFIRILQGYGVYPLYAHVGGANTPGPADALGEIRELGWGNYNDLNQFSVPFPNFWRDYERLPGVATEHTMYTDTAKLWSFAAKNRNLTNVDEEGTSWDESFTSWKFADDAKTKGNTVSISYEFWTASRSTMGVDWAYDPKTNSYLRSNGGKPHLDKNTEEQLRVKNVVVMEVDESPANDGYPGGHLLYDLIGSGKAYIFQNGNAIEGKWSKDDEESRIIFTDAKGAEISIVRGKVWVSVVPTGAEVEF